MWPLRIRIDDPSITTRACGTLVVTVEHRAHDRRRVADGVFDDTDSGATGDAATISALGLVRATARCGAMSPIVDLQRVRRSRARHRQRFTARITRRPRSTMAPRGVVAVSITSGPYPRVPGGSSGGAGLLLGDVPHPWFPPPSSQLAAAVVQTRRQPAPRTVPCPKHNSPWSVWPFNHSPGRCAIREQSTARCGGATTSPTVPSPADTRRRAPSLPEASAAPRVELTRDQLLNCTMSQGGRSRTAKAAAGEQEHRGASCEKNDRSRPPPACKSSPHTDSANATVSTRWPRRHESRANRAPHDDHHDRKIVGRSRLHQRPAICRARCRLGAWGGEPRLGLRVAQLVDYFERGSMYRAFIAARQACGCDEGA